MRLLELRTNGASSPVLEFHPNLTIVVGLSAAARAKVIEAVEALPAAADVGFGGLLEAEGVFFDLSPETLQQFGLGSPLDVVVRSDDLPQRGGGPAPARAAAPPVPTAPAVDPAAVEARRRDYEDAKEAYEVLEQAHERAQKQVAAADDARQRITAALEAARRERDQARAARDSPSGGAGSLTSDEAVELRSRLEELTARRGELARAIEELERQRDPRPVEVLVEEYHKPPSDNLVPSREAVALADEFADLQAKLAAFEAKLEADGMGIESSFRRLDEARAELVDAQKAVEKPKLTPEDERELDEAHDAVLEVEQRMNKRIGRKAAERALEEAREREQAILDRVGFPTYSSYVMGASLLNIDPMAEQRLERAQAELATAEEAWESLTVQLENDPDYAELLDRVEAVHLVALDLLGSAEEEDLEQRLRDLRVPEEEVPKEDVVDALVYQLGLVGVDVDESSPQDVVIYAAERWLEESAGHWDRWQDLKREEADVETSLAATEERMDVLHAEAQATGESDQRLDDDVRAAESKVAEIVADLEQVTELGSELSDQVDARSALTFAAELAMNAAKARYDEELAAQAAAPGPSPEPKDTSLYDSLPYADGDEEGDAVSVSVEDVEFYLQSRVSPLRSVCDAGSVPLVVDDALSVLEPDEAHQVLDRLGELAQSVQVIYLTDDDRAVAWAEAAGFERVAAVEAPAGFAS